MTIDEFGQTIKSKYPQYNDVDNAELGRKMLEKYPQYKDRVETQSPILSSLGKSAGGLAKGANVVTDVLFPRTKKFITEDLPGYYKKGAPKSYKEQLQRTAEIAPKSLAVGGELGAWAMPATKAAKGASFLKKVGAGAATGARIGGVMGATGEAENLEDRAKNTFMSTLTGGAFGGATTAGMEGVGATLRWLNLTEKGKNLFASTLKDDKTAQKVYQKSGGKEAFAEKAIKKGQTKSKSGFIKELEQYQDEFNNKIEGALSKSKRADEKVTVDFNKIRQKIKNELGSPETVDEFNQAIKYLDEAEKTYRSFSVKGANKKRIKLDRMVGEKLFEETKGKAKAIKYLADELRKAVKTTVPETKPYFDKYSLLSSLIEVSRVDPTVGIMEILGGSLGGSVYGFPGSGVGLATSFLARRPSVKRQIAQKTYSAGSAVSRGLSTKTKDAIEILKRLGIIKVSEQSR